MPELIVDLKPTENPDKVIATVKNIFPDADLKIKGERITGKTDASHFWDLIKQQRIRATINSLLEENAEKGKTYIDLAKMAAIAGRVAINEDFPLGKIRLVLPWKGAKK